MGQVNQSPIGSGFPFSRVQSQVSESHSREDSRGRDGNDSVLLNLEVLEEGCIGLLVWGRGCKREVTLRGNQRFCFQGQG